MRRKRILISALATALAVNACAAKKATPYLGEEQRARLGRVAIVVVETAPTARVDGPTPLGALGGGVKGAAKGVGLGVGGTVLFGAGCFVTLGYCGPCCILTVASAGMTPYLVGRGAVEGAKDAVPETKRREHQAAIVTAIAAVDTQRLARAIEEARRCRLTDDGAAGSGVDTVAEVTLLRLGLETVPHTLPASAQSLWKMSVPDVDPTLGVVAEARLRLVSKADQKVVFETAYVHRSNREAKLAEWGRDGAADFKAARDETLDALARDVATELFGPAPPEPAPPGNDAPPAEKTPPAGGVPPAEQERSAHQAKSARAASASRAVPRTS